MDDEQIIKVLEERGGSLKDLLLVGDPTAVSRWTPQGNLYGLVIEDGAIWRECVDFLRRNGVPRSRRQTMRKTHSFPCPTQEMNTASNKSRRRLSDKNINLKFEHLSVSLIGALQT